ncbi:TPA: SWIM zinc finger family protein [Staphylococcus aureus]|uniref:SWIM zinc finger family protein n=1 Tax=Staphylococcus aureus TaxID=1280 RepID=UPI0006BA81BC|nr:SWIM zinc finger family protein [Staphylococcus aureus]HCZ8191947.1 SWIM zinc finger family protein [Staphylococcus aureus]HCZ8195267.1 SWIM zinc finger family protein [Staphylococcus aureus]HCZ8221419.1 SWIM zinc finger family protein [Staphylococcus aureus]HCZ8224330.1 SWIM zinc finger family protein [Staphylococcus aureus]HCZ8227028.1 SWIM zinc finger family protein [Staphylococcus aureus]
MGLLDIASIRSIERGFSYYQSKCVINLKSYSETQFEAEVKGSGSNVYRCYIDMEHPRKSKCNCPHADGRRVICKHMIALLFTASPEAANKHTIMLNEVEEDYHLRRNMWIDSLKEMVNDMSEEELRDAYLNTLIEHGEMAELFGLDEEEDLFEDENEFH